MKRIVAGEPTLHAWCATCQLPTRIRIPLHLGHTSAPIANVLEVCPGCGTGHDRPRVELTKASEPPQGSWLARIARHVHGWTCRRKGIQSRPCAYADCWWPGLHRNEVTLPGEDGVWRYYFCRATHRQAWATANGLRL